MVERVRVSIAITPEVHATFQRLATANGSSLARTIGDWLGDTCEAAEFVSHKVIQAKSQPRAVLREMQALVGGAADEVTALLEGKYSEESSDSGGGAAGARGAGGAPKPPSSHTGVNSPKRAKGQLPRTQKKEPEKRP